MITVNDAVLHLERIFLDEFKSAILDKPTYPDIILNVHKYFKYQTRIYTFSSADRVKQLYDTLRVGNISDVKLVDGKDASYPLLFLTETAQKLLVALSVNGYADNPEVAISPNDMLNILGTELATLMTMHGYEQPYVKDDYYQSCIDPTEWTNIIVSNPWMLIAILIGFTSYELTDNLYGHLGASDALKGAAE